MHRTIWAASACLLVAGPSLTRAAFINDFATDTVGSAPASVTVIEPAAFVGTGANDGDTLVTTVATSAIGTGNAMRIVDRATTAVIVRETFGESFLTGVLSFGFTAGPNVGTDGNSFLRVALGSANTNASSSGSVDNYMRVTFSSPNSTNIGGFGASNVSSGSLADISAGTFNETAGNLVQIVFNRTSLPLDYLLGTGHTVAANRYDLYLNGALVGDDLLLRTGTGAVTAMSFGTGGGQKGADWIIDNLAVSAPLPIPEPATAGLLLASAPTLLRRRRR